MERSRSIAAATVLVAGMASLTGCATQLLEPPDLEAPPDLAASPDLAVPPDLARPSDDAAPPDLRPPDLALPAQTWGRTFGSPFRDRGLAIAADAAGHLYVTGFTESLLSNLHVGGDDVFLARLDGAGDVLWVRQIGTSFEDHGTAVATDAAGDVYVAGYTAAWFADLPGNTMGDDLFLAKYDGAGNRLWLRQLGTSSPVRAHGLAVDGAGGVYVTGAAAGNLDGRPSAGASDLFLVKYDGGGNRLWTRLLGTAADDGATAVAADAAGGVYVTGYTLGALDGNPSAGPGVEDVVLVKYDGAGNKLWTRQLGTPRADVGTGVAVDGAGNVYVAGTTGGGLDGNPNATPSGPPEDDIFLTSYDAAGTKRWTRQLGTPKRDQGAGVAADGAGNVYVAGTTAGVLDGTNQGAGKSDDLVVIKYGSAGDRRWTRQRGTDRPDQATGIALDRGGQPCVSGYVQGDPTGDTGTTDDSVLVIKLLATP